MRLYVVFDGPSAVGTEASLVSAYASARWLATEQPGRKLSVERDGEVVVTCEVSNGKMKAWVR